MPILLISLGVFILDQVTKYVVQHRMFEGQSIPIINHVFHLTFIRNPGAAFGMLPYRTSFFIIIAVIVVLGAIWYYRKLPKDQPLLKIAIGLVLGGALGNLTDRIIYGTVVDFLDFRIWPIFNVADIAISIAVVLLFWDLLKHKESGDAS